ncbi:unnamed protein product, partial [Prorocentrum cordatum]
GGGASKSACARRGAAARAASAAAAASAGLPPLRGRRPCSSRRRAASASLAWSSAPYVAKSRIVASACSACRAAKPRSCRHSRSLASNSCCSSVSSLCWRASARGSAASGAAKLGAAAGPAARPRCDRRSASLRFSSARASSSCWEDLRRALHCDACACSSCTCRRRSWTRVLPPSNGVPVVGERLEALSVLHRRLHEPLCQEVVLVPQQLDATRRPRRS